MGPVMDVLERKQEGPQVSSQKGNRVLSLSGPSLDSINRLAFKHTNSVQDRWVRGQVRSQRMRSFGMICSSENFTLKSLFLDKMFNAGLCSAVESNLFLFSDPFQLLYLPICHLFTTSLATLAPPPGSFPFFHTQVNKSFPLPLNRTAILQGG